MGQDTDPTPLLARSTPMNFAIRPTEPADLPALGRFLASGFGAPPEAEFASADVLSWRYFDPRGVGDPARPRSFLAVDESDGRIVGHIGSAPTDLLVARPGGAVDRVPTMHMLDWLRAPDARAVGAYLMRRAHSAAPTQYGLGGTEAARATARRAGYIPATPAPAFRLVLRPGHRLRDAGAPPARRLAAAARDLGRSLVRPARRPSAEIGVDPSSRFDGPMAATLADESARAAILSARDPGLLNHLMRHPRDRVRGWTVHRRGVPIGLALTSRVEVRGTRLARIVEWLVAGDPADRADAVAALVAALRRDGADAVVALGGTPEVEAALRACGFRPAHTLDILVRDPSGLLPRDRPFRASFVEADYATA